jgi:DNA-binding transcriptional LysR family regulator
MPFERLPYLETFAKAAESGSFTAVARSLGLSQAAISQRIQALERDLVASLFCRHGGRVLLTDVGRCLYTYSQRILTLHAEARRALTGQTQPITGSLALAASSVPGEHVVPALLPGFHRRHPQLQN